MSERREDSELAALKARVAELEGRQAESTYVGTPSRRVGLVLGLLILIAPYFFAWLLLGRGYSNAARAISFGWLMVLVVILVFAVPRSPSPTSANRPQVQRTVIDPERNAKDMAASVAERDVPRFLKDPDSARFGKIWGMSGSVACGYVNAKNSFGGYTGEQRFIYAFNSVAVEDGSEKFRRTWNSLCVDRPKEAAPNGIPGHAFGSRPTADMTPAGPATDEGLRVYSYKQNAPAFEGIKPTELVMLYDHNKLYQAEYVFEGEANREAVKAALVKKYGTPQAYDEGREFYKWSWSKAKRSIRIDYRPQWEQTAVSFAQDQ